jgi:hypothetical protein
MGRDPPDRATGFQPAAGNARIPRSRAIVVDPWLEPGELPVKEIPEPALPPSCLDVEVRAAGCNVFDIPIRTRESRM